MTLNVESPRVYTRHGVPISVTGIAQVRQCADDVELHSYFLLRMSANNLLFFAWGETREQWGWFYCPFSQKVPLKL